MSDLFEKVLLGLLVDAVELLEDVDLAGLALRDAEDAAEEARAEQLAQHQIRGAEDLLRRRPFAAAARLDPKRLRPERKTKKTKTKERRLEEKNNSATESPKPSGLVLRDRLFSFREENVKRKKTVPITATGWLRTATNERPENGDDI